MTGPDIDSLFRDGDAIDRAIGEAVIEALPRHKKLGESIAVWQDGKVVILPPEKIPVDLDDAADNAADPDAAPSGEAESG